jgi:hypothetical protein
MALTIDATAGGASANCYCTLAEAYTYHESRLHSMATWDAADDGEEKTPALIWATRLLDESVKWIGSKSTETQALRWPRQYIYDIDGIEIESTIIPQFLKNATAEFAFYLLSNDLTADDTRDLMGFEELKVGPISLKVDKYTKKPVLPRSVAYMVRRYSTIGRISKRLERM